jgi:hypothetical protein
MSLKSILQFFKNKTSGNTKKVDTSIRSTRFFHPDREERLLVIWRGNTWIGTTLADDIPCVVSLHDLLDDGWFPIKRPGLSKKKRNNKQVSHNRSGN